MHAQLLGVEAALQWWMNAPFLNNANLDSALAGEGHQRTLELANYAEVPVALNMCQLKVGPISRPSQQMPLPG